MRTISAGAACGISFPASVNINGDATGVASGCGDGTGLRSSLDAGISRGRGPGLRLFGRGDIGGESRLAAAADRFFAVACPGIASSASSIIRFYERKYRMIMDGLISAIYWIWNDQRHKLKHMGVTSVKASAV